MNARRKQELLKLEAEHLENARFLNRADVVVMTESDEDERFWRAVFNHAVPNLKIMFNCDTYLSLVIKILLQLLTNCMKDFVVGMQERDACLAIKA